MYKTFTLLFFIILTLKLPCKLFAQNQDRMQVIQGRLDNISVEVPGLDQKVQLLVTGISIQDYLTALAKVNRLSISIDPKLNFTIYDTFNGVTASNILVFLAKKYNLDITVVGSIIYITAYNDPALNTKPLNKEIVASYTQLDNSLTLELNNDTLATVAKKITQVSGKNVVVPNTLQNKLVTAFIKSAPFDVAMEKLAFANNIKMTKTSDNFYVFQPLDENEEVYVNGDRNTSVRRSFRPTPTEHALAGMFVKTVNGQKLISADVSNAPIADLIRQASQELNKNYSIYTDVKGALTLHVNDVTYENFLNLLFNGTDYTFQEQNGVYLIGDSKMQGLRTFKVLQLQNRAIDTLVEMIPAEWKKNIEIKEFREQNTILLSGSEARINEVASLIKQLDVLVPVVMIEVTLIDIHKTRSVSTGISAGVADSAKASGGTVLSGLNYTFNSKSINSFLNSIGKVVNLGHVTPNFYLTLSALETNNNVDARSVPRLTALNGHAATLSIGNSVYYKNSTQNYIPSAATTQTLLTNTYVESDANLFIGIKPLVSGDDQVTLGIKVDISDFTSIPTDGSPPPKSTSKFESSIRVNNEDMIVLGGIERTEKDDSGSGIPLLSRIPVLKWIFSSRTKTNSKVVTLVFIKPTILR